MTRNRKADSDGVETEGREVSQGALAGDGPVADRLTIRAPHVRLTQVELIDATDRHNELVHEREWMLHPSERELSLRGNLFVVEDVGEGTGRILVNTAPLPDSRPSASACDLRVVPCKGSGFEFHLMETAGAGSWTILEFAGGRIGRSRVLHGWQRAQRPSTRPHTVPRFLVNTWGDRSRDSRIERGFIDAEIAAVERLGADVLQLDDGWQRGTTSNSARAAELGGVWEGFWNADPRFWDPHPERLPEGLEPIVSTARARGVGIGLWFAPDSWNAFANWRRDAERVLELHGSLGIVHFKIDGVKTPTLEALANLRRFVKAVLDGSGGAVVLDLDITAGMRPGYFGAIEAGPLFVENRYTDWHNYWPHQTLRNLWKLAHWIDPGRLRMEFLNNARNIDAYAGDPLAPVRYDPTALFATVMLSNPLGWFEASNLPESYTAAVSPLVAVWKEHREALLGGTIVPIGSAPDGFSWTGFLSLGDGGTEGYVLAFRGLGMDERAVLQLSGVDLSSGRWEILASDGSVASAGGAVSLQVPDPLGFVFARWCGQGVGRRR